MSRYTGMRYMAKELKGQLMSVGMLPKINGAYMKAMNFYRFVHPSYKCCECTKTKMCPACMWWDEYIEEFDNYQELFILYIMKTQHNKIWDINNKEWIVYDRHAPLITRREDEREK